MNNIDYTLLKTTYDKCKNLKIAATELNMKWQTLYYHLNLIGHPVTGDKERYGSPTDKLARKTEKLFNSILPEAEDLNNEKFQNDIDFKYKNISIDVKSSTKKDGYKNNPRKNAAFRWAFSVAVQEKSADYLVCFCYAGHDCEDSGDVEKILLIPSQFFKNKQSISVSCSKSKWYDFEVSEQDLREFLLAL